MINTGFVCSCEQWADNYAHWLINNIYWGLRENINLSTSLKVVILLRETSFVNLCWLSNVHNYNTHLAIVMFWFAPLRKMFWIVLLKFANESPSDRLCYYSVLISVSILNVVCAHLGLGLYFIAYAINSLNSYLANKILFS